MNTNKGNYENNYKNYYNLREKLQEEQKRIKKADDIIEKYFKKEKLNYSDAEHIYKLLGLELYNDLKTVIVNNYY